MRPQQWKAIIFLAFIWLYSAILILLWLFVPYALGRDFLQQAFVLLCLPVLLIVVFRVKNDPGDERDRAIERRSTCTAAIVGMGAQGFAALVIYAFSSVYGKETVPLNSLALPVLVGLVLFISADCIAVLVLYHRGGGDAED